MRTKVLEIKNEKQLKKFNHRLFIYKSFLYKNVYFKIEDDKFSLSTMISALNIKKYRKRIEYIYDEACNQIDAFYKNKNMCGFKDNKCYVQQLNKQNKVNGCCRKCRFQCSKGCPTKNLACKLFYCSEAEKRHKLIKFEDLKILNLLNKRQRFIVKSDYFSSKEEVLNDLYMSSLLLSIIRIMYRISPAIIKTKKA